MPCLQILRPHSTDMYNLQCSILGLQQSLLFTCPKSNPRPTITSILTSLKVTTCLTKNLNFLDSLRVGGGLGKIILMNLSHSWDSAVLLAAEWISDNTANPSTIEMLRLSAWRMAGLTCWHLISWAFYVQTNLKSSQWVDEWEELRKYTFSCSREERGSQVRVVTIRPKIQDGCWW